MASGRDIGTTLLLVLLGAAGLVSLLYFDAPGLWDELSAVAVILISAGGLAGANRASKRSAQTAARAEVMVVELRTAAALLGDRRITTSEYAQFDGQLKESEDLVLALIHAGEGKVAAELRGAALELALRLQNQGEDPGPVGGKGER